MDDVFDWRYTGDGIFGENGGELEGKSAGEFAVEIDGAAAHSGNDAGAFDLGTFQLDKNDGLPRSKEIGHHADDFQIEFLYLVTGEYGERISLHAGSNLVEGENFIGLREQSDGKESSD